MVLVAVYTLEERWPGRRHRLSFRLVAETHRPAGRVQVHVCVHTRVCAHACVWMCLREAIGAGGKQAWRKK